MKQQYKTFAYLTSSFFTSLLILWSCNDDGSSEFELTAELTYATNYVDLEAISLNTIMLVDEFLRDSTLKADGQSFLYGDIMGEMSSNELTITYGKAGVGSSNPDGIMRSGKINVSFTGGQYQTTGSTTTISFDQFHFQTKPVSGTLLMLNNGLLPNGQEFEILLDSLTLDSNSLSFTRFLLHDSPFSPVESLDRTIVVSTVSTAHFFDNETQIHSLILLQDPMTLSDDCQFKISKGMVEVLPDSTLAGTNKLVVDYIEESGCANLIRCYSEDKDGYFFLPKRGF